MNTGNLVLVLVASAGLSVGSHHLTASLRNDVRGADRDRQVDGGAAIEHLGPEEVFARPGRDLCDQRE